MADGFQRTSDGTIYIVVRPGENRPYGIDWTSKFGADPVVSAVWTIPEGLTAGLQQIDGQITRKKIGGFVDGESYYISCLANTQSGSSLPSGFYMICRRDGGLDLM